MGERTMKSLNYLRFIKFTAVILPLLLSTAVVSVGQKVTRSEAEVTILVTAMPHDDKSRAVAGRLESSDFAVFENKQKQKIVSVKNADDSPIVFAVLVQDNLIGGVNNQLPEIRDFIRGLPKGSKAMVGYVGTGSLQVRQNFTTDLNKAADSLRIVTGSPFSEPYSPYLHVVDALKLFTNQPSDERRMLLLISDGLDDTFGFRLSSPLYSVYLDNAVRTAQRNRVAVFTIYASSTTTRRRSRMAYNYGQGSLLRLSDETGGQALFSGIEFVSFDPYFREYRNLLKDQWLITYESATTGKGFRRIDVQTDFDIDLQFPDGYYPD